MHGFPFWTVETTRRHGLRRRRRNLLSPQTYPEAVGQWLDEYRDRSGDLGFTEVVVLEHPLPGIAPIEIDPHTMIQALRDTTQRYEVEQRSAFEERRSPDH